MKGHIPQASERGSVIPTHVRKKIKAKMQDRRMMSNRFEMNMDVSHYNLLRQDSDEETVITPYSDQLAIALYGKNQVSGALENEKILVLCKKPPRPIEKYHEQLRRICEENKGGRRGRYDRVISDKVIRTLDAPGVIDDYYTSLLDWNTFNMIALALRSALYVWRDESTTPTLIFDHCDENDDDDCFSSPNPPFHMITSVAWSDRLQECIVIGKENGSIHVWDIERGVQVRQFDGHASRVGCLDVNQHIATSGSRDSFIINWDLRMRNARVSTFEGHRSEVCVVKWNHDQSVLASGSSDETIRLWPGLNHSPPHIEIESHTTTVKAIAWCPWQHDLLATGAGQSDPTIRLWNTNSYVLLDHIETGSQISSLLWSESTKELISSHGYSTNRICVWQYPTMRPLVEWHGHQSRVLDMALSPDGNTLLSLGADETLRFWPLRTPVVSNDTPLRGISSRLGPTIR